MEKQLLQLLIRKGNPYILLVDLQPERARLSVQHHRHMLALMHPSSVVNLALAEVHQLALGDVKAPAHVVAAADRVDVVLARRHSDRDLVVVLPDLKREPVLTLLSEHLLAQDRGDAVGLVLDALAVVVHLEVAVAALVAEGLVGAQVRLELLQDLEQITLVLFQLMLLLCYGLLHGLNLGVLGQGQCLPLLHELGYLVVLVCHVLYVVQFVFTQVVLKLFELVLGRHPGVEALI